MCTWQWWTGYIYQFSFVPTVYQLWQTLFLVSGIEPHDITVIRQPRWPLCQSLIGLDIVMDTGFCRPIQTGHRFNSSISSLVNFLIYITRLGSSSITEVEHMPCDLKVVGSIPAMCFAFFLFLSLSLSSVYIHQWVAQLLMFSTKWMHYASWT